MKETRNRDTKEGRQGWSYELMEESRKEQANTGIGKVMKNLRIRLTLWQEYQK